MATLSTVLLTPLNSATPGATAGQAAGWVTPTAAVGDLIPLTGKGVILRVKTTGTATNAVIDSVVPSNYGADQDLTMALSATDEQEVFIANDPRFDQGGVNKGYAKVTCSSITGASIAAKVISG